MTTNLYQQLVAQNLRAPPEYGRGFSNHRSMALHALQALRATDTRLQAFYDAYGSHFASDNLADKPIEPIFAADWPQALGNIDAYTSLTAHFAAMLATDGAQTILEAVLPILWPGMAAAAFHGIIRTAHAVEALSAAQLSADTTAQQIFTAELSHSLAYWAARWQATPVPAATKKLPVNLRLNLSFADWTAQLHAAALLKHSVAASISKRIAEAITTADYANLGGNLELEPDTLHKLSRWIAKCYSETANFTVLHMLTGLRAVIILHPFLAQQQAVDALKQAIFSLTAAYLASNIGASKSEILPPDVATTWAQYIAQAMASDDEHDIKLMHALVWFNQRDASPASNPVSNPVSSPFYITAAARLFSSRVEL